MNNQSRDGFWIIAVAIILGNSALTAAPVVTSDRWDSDEATAAFKFNHVPEPAKGDAAEKAALEVIAGEYDRNGGNPSVLIDGRLPNDPDEPGANFFFRAGTDGGKLRLDLGRLVEIKEVNSFSWHPAERGPQVYTLYGSDGLAAGFKAKPSPEIHPEAQGWQRIATVDTRPNQGESGGQYGVRIADEQGNLGKFRYLLFDISRTESHNPFGNTFYSEIDVIEAGSTVTPITAGSAIKPPFVIWTSNQTCRISIDTSRAPELKEWAETKLGPILANWHPRLTQILHSEGYHPPSRFSIIIKPEPGFAATSGTRVTANSQWLASALDTEAIGALLHEQVHVLQQYGRTPRNAPGSKPPPGWLIEGIPDYVRWFVYEPQSHGADIVWMRGLRRFSPRYDQSYRVSANFLDYVSRKYDTNLVTKLNAACREHRDTDEVFNKATGKTTLELNDEWVRWVKAELEKKDS